MEDPSFPNFLSDPVKQPFQASGMPLGKPNERLARRFAKNLRKCQAEDKPLPDPWMYSIRYTLPWLGRAFSCISVVPDSLEASPFDIQRDAIPEFFRSQLESQRLMPPNLPRIPLSPLLEFVLGIVPKDPKDGHPILFRSYSRVRKRHQYIFVFSAIEIMPLDCGRYQLEELLELQKQEAPTNLQSILAKDPDLCKLIRKSESHGQSRHRRSAVASETLAASGSMPVKKSNLDDSSGSEEVLWKGRAAYRQQVNRTKQDQRQQRSFDSIKLEAAVAPKTATALNEKATQTSQEVPSKLGHFNETQPDEQAEMVWKYRGRAAEEMDISHPIPPPAESSTQKCEGFKRFFKAVKSPDHVRVTAGGRIVPNTRGLAGPSSPVPNKRHDDPVPTGNGAGGSATTSQAERQRYMINQTGRFPGVMQFQQPLVSHVFPAMPVVVPIPFGSTAPPGHQFHPPPPGYYPVPPPGSQNMLLAPVPMNTHLHGVHSIKSNDGQAPSSDPVKENAKVKISPPEQFDSTKPIMFNGQVMFPAPSHFLPSPGSFFPLYPGLHNAPAGLRPSSGPVAMSASPPPVMTVPMAPAQATNGPPLVMPGSCGVMDFGMISARPISCPEGPAPTASSIKMSAISQKHIDTLNASLRWYQDQLQYNRHQIDEEEFRETIDRIKHTIRHFESERERYQKIESDRTGETREPQAAASGENLSFGIVERVGSLTSRKASAVDDNVDDYTTDLCNDDAPSSLSGTVKFHCGDVKPAYDWQGRSLSTLSSAAALAPPFRPHGLRETASVDTGLQVPEEQLESNRRALAVSKPPLKLASRENMSRTRDWLSTSGTRVPDDTPYLVGHFPYGTPQTGKYVEYVYSRPLSKAELRARELYWGKASRADRQGLPKFDGQNFYPASPDKKDASDDSARMVTPSAHQFQDCATEAAPKHKSDLDPFRPVTPVRQAAMDRLGGNNDESCAYTDRISELSLRGETDKVRYNEGMDRATRGSVIPKGDPKVTEATALKSGENNTNPTGSLERRSERGGGARIWEVVLKKPSASSALSSTTAQGLLPQFKGHAAASLSPSMTRSSASPLRDVSPSKMLDLETQAECNYLPSVDERLEENRPLHRTG